MFDLQTDCLSSSCLSFPQVLSALSAGLQAPAASLISSPHLEARRIPERRRCELRCADGRMYRVSRLSSGRQTLREEIYSSSFLLVVLEVSRSASSVLTEISKQILTFLQEPPAGHEIQMSVKCVQSYQCQSMWSLWTDGERTRKNGDVVPVSWVYFLDQALVIV